MDLYFLSNVKPFPNIIIVLLWEEGKKIQLMDEKEKPVDKSTLLWRIIKQLDMMMTH